MFSLKRAGDKRQVIPTNVQIIIRFGVYNTPLRLIEKF